jgi:hypothetical protein
MRLRKTDTFRWMGLIPKWITTILTIIVMIVGVIQYSSGIEHDIEINSRRLDHVEQWVKEQKQRQNQLQHISEQLDQLQKTLTQEQQP